jgi:hypothetical protein
MSKTEQEQVSRRKACGTITRRSKMLMNVTSLFSEKRISALLAAASVGVLIAATTSAEAYVRRGGAGVGVGHHAGGVGRIGAGVGYRRGVGRAGVGVAGWRNGAGYGRYGYRGVGYGAAALTGAALGYSAANAYSSGYGYPAGYAANTGLVTAPVAATTSGGYYGGSWDAYARFNGIKCQAGSLIQMEDGVTYLCQ